MNPSVAVVIPCYRVKSALLGVIRDIGPEIQHIIVVDDACPEQTGAFIQQHNQDPRVKVFFQDKNSGVGGASLRGFKEAYSLGAKIIVKLDGDGQMDPKLIPSFIAPIHNKKADFVKGNRFFMTQVMSSMPPIRLLGNLGVSFLAKIASGYWQIMDPSNGFLAFHSSLLPFLEPHKIEKRYFFENDFLFRLGLLPACVLDMPMHARYGDEQSSLSISHTLLVFPGKFLKRFLKRILYRYFIRDFNLGSLLMLGGITLNIFGAFFGAYHWRHGVQMGVPASSGTVMLSALPILLGMQMLFFSFLYDVLSSPKEAIYPHLEEILHAGLKTDFKI